MRAEPVPPGLPRRSCLTACAPLERSRKASLPSTPSQGQRWNPIASGNTRHANGRHLRARSRAPCGDPGMAPEVGERPLTVTGDGGLKGLNPARWAADSPALLVEVGRAERHLAAMRGVARLTAHGPCHGIHSWVSRRNRRDVRHAGSGIAGSLWRFRSRGSRWSVGEAQHGRTGRMRGQHPPCFVDCRRGTAAVRAIGESAGGRRGRRGRHRACAGPATPTRVVTRIGGLAAQTIMMFIPRDAGRVGFPARRAVVDIHSDVVRVGARDRCESWKQAKHRWTGVACRSHVLEDGTPGRMAIRGGCGHRAGKPGGGWVRSLRAIEPGCRFFTVGCRVVLREEAPRGRWRRRRPPRARAAGSRTVA